MSSFVMFQAGDAVAAGSFSSVGSPGSGRPGIGAPGGVPVQVCPRMPKNLTCACKNSWKHAAVAGILMSSSVMFQAGVFQTSAAAIDAHQQQIEGPSYNWQCSVTCPAAIGQL